MNQDSNSTGSDASARSLAADSWVLSAVVARWGLVAVAVLYWVGLVGFSPLDLLPEITPEDPPNFMGAPLWFMREFMAGISWGLLSIPWVAYVRYRVGVIEAGSEVAYYQQRRAEHKRASTPTPAGELIAVSISKGGLTSISETLIETTEGFYRVEGLVGTAMKGDPVSLLGGKLLIGTGHKQKRYTVIS